MQTRNSWRLAAAFVLAAPWIQAADFTYSEKTEITSGSLKQTLQLAAQMTGQSTGPAVSTYRYSGDKLLVQSGDTSTIVDLAKETITYVDSNQKQFSVLTFAEMNGVMKIAMERIGQAPAAAAEGAWKISAEPTGKAKVLARVNAKEVVVKAVEGSTEITIDGWREKVAGDEVRRQFARKLAAKLNYPLNANPLTMAQMGALAAEGMREAARKASELDGMPIRTVTRASGPAGVIVESTSEVQSFSAAKVDPAVFQVPAGFEQVGHPMKQAFH